MTIDIQANIYFCRPFLVGLYRLSDATVYRLGWLRIEVMK